jgi:hypothetical protein
MLIHDWTRVPSGLFHDFHQSWSVRIKDALNKGILPKGLSALVEQRAGAREPDAVERRGNGQLAESVEGPSLATLERPTAKIVQRTSKVVFAGRANRIVVRHHLGRIVAVIEIVSPGNKDGRSALRDFVEKIMDLLKNGVHVLIIDLFPPSVRDPFGIHKLIWDEIEEEEFVFPKGKDRILVSYESGRENVAYIEPLAVGDIMPDMRLFLAPSFHVPVPLEATYDAAWEAIPEEMRIAVETGVLPDTDQD